MTADLFSPRIGEESQKKVMGETIAAWTGIKYK